MLQQSSAFHRSLLNLQTGGLYTITRCVFHELIVGFFAVCFLCAICCHFSLSSAVLTYFVLVCAREKKMSRTSALKVLDHAMIGPEGVDNCQKFVDILGLGRIFPLFIKTPKAHKKAGPNKRELEGEYCVVLHCLVYEKVEYFFIVPVIISGNLSNKMFCGIVCGIVEHV